MKSLSRRNIYLIFCIIAINGYGGISALSSPQNDNYISSSSSNNDDKSMIRSVQSTLDPIPMQTLQGMKPNEQQNEIIASDFDSKDNVTNTLWMFVLPFAVSGFLGVGLLVYKKIRQA